jgi:hypothetical protein
MRWNSRWWTNYLFCQSGCEAISVSRCHTRLAHRRSQVLFPAEWRFSAMCLDFRAHSALWRQMSSYFWWGSGQWRHYHCTKASQIWDIDKLEKLIAKKALSEAEMSTNVMKRLCFTTNNLFVIFDQSGWRINRRIVLYL